MVKIAGESRSPWASLWPLDPAIAYLNHGSFGACPTAILEKQSELRLEREPVDFLVRELPRHLAEARAALAGFVGADGDDLAFVPNATAGINAVARSRGRREARNERDEDTEPPYDRTKDAPTTVASV